MKRQSMSARQENRNSLETRNGLDRRAGLNASAAMPIKVAAFLKNLYRGYRAVQLRPPDPEPRTLGLTHSSQLRLPTMPRSLPLPALCLGLLLAAPLPAQAPMTASDSARHVLNRLAYGARPGEIEAVAQAGVMNWIDRQLGFEDVRDPALAQLEASFDVLHTSPGELQELQQKNLARVRQAQALGDSSARQAMVNQIRREQQVNRRALQTLLMQLQTITVARAVESDHQLDEILADFWTNHFNVFINKGRDRAYFADFLERTIRGHMLGKFADLLIATARSPAMLFYLDNATSVADGTQQRMSARRRTKTPSRRTAPNGLNENYARELLELHTLGVDGGYTQQDVVAVARILTGWGIDRRTASYIFRPIAHDNQAKAFLGQTFPAGGGEAEGIRLLRMLASEPATMHHVSAELCTRFVADVPPDGCIDSAVRAWKRSDGELREVVRAIILSPDFLAAANIDSKVKTPLEFVASALRAVAAVPDSTPRLAQRIGRLGEPLFQHTTPDGYGEREEDWVNSGALLERMNFAVQLASGRMPGARVDLDRVVAVTDDHAALVAAVDRSVLGGVMSAQTRATILKELADITDPRMARALAVGLAIGGPEFQRQ